MSGGYDLANLFGTNSEKGTIVTGATDWRDHNHRSWGLLSIFRTLFGNLPQWGGTREQCLQIRTSIGPSLQIQTESS